MKRFANWKLVLLLPLLFSCSGADEAIDEGLEKTVTLSIPITVKGGEVDARGVNSEGVPEGNYPMNRVCMWAGSAGNWKTLSLPYSGENIELAITEEKGVITASYGTRSISFGPDDVICFSSQIDAVFSLGASSDETPGGTPTYDPVGDVLFRSTENYRYDSATRRIVSVPGNSSVENGISMDRVTSVIQFNVVVTSFAEQDVTRETDDFGTTITHKLGANRWQELFDSPPSAWAGRSFVTNFPYSYNIYEKAVVSPEWDRVIRLSTGNQTLSAQRTSATSASVTNMYQGYGGGSDYRFLYAVGPIASGSSRDMEIAITFSHPGGYITAKAMPYSTLDANTTYTAYIILDAIEMQAAISRSAARGASSSDDGMWGENSVEVPVKELYMNGELVMRDGKRLSPLR